MNFIIAYFKGFWQVLRSGKIWGIHYLSLLILALLSTLPFFNLMQRKVGHSKAIEQLLPDFDYTVFQDFQNLPGVKESIAAFMNMNQWLLLLFFVLSVFMTGGVLSVYKKMPQRFDLRSFFSGCTYYFWRLLRMTTYFLIVHLIIIGLFVMIFRLVTKDGFDAMGSEVGYINLLKVLVPIYLLLASWFFMVQDYAKIHLVHRDEGFLFKSFWQSFPLVFGNFFNTFFLYVLNAATFVGLTALFYFLNERLLTDTPSGVALAFLLGQAFVLGRIGVRLLNLASATLVYKGIMAKRERKANQAKEAEAARLQAIAEAEAEAVRTRLEAENAAAAAAAASLEAKAAQEAAAAYRPIPPPAERKDITEEEEE